jgi:hypothetical protein
VGFGDGEPIDGVGEPDSLGSGLTTGDGDEVRPRCLAGVGMVGTGAATG